MSIITEKNTNIKIRLCRICLDSKCVDMVLMEEQNGWFKLFEFCFGVTLTKQDEPRLLCQICAEKVQSFVKFKEKCEKSHSIWKSVCSTVKCCVVKHVPKPSEDTKKNEIKEEVFDTFLEDDIHYSDEDEIEMFDISFNKIKNETLENDTNSIKEDSSSEEYYDDVNKNKADSKLENCKIINSDSGKKKTKKVYTCVKCKEKYGKKGWYFRHIEKCQRKVFKKKLKKPRTFNQDYAYDLGRNYFGQNVPKIKNESEVEIKIIENQYQDASLMSCGLCSHNFATIEETCMHLNNHWSNNDLACKLCDFVGIDLAATMAHRYSHFSREGIKRFLCHICKKFHQSLMSLHFHYRKDHLKKPGGYCSRCNKEYRLSRLWKKHELTHWPRKYICDICGKAFVFKHSIREHIINHMRVNMSICDVCGKGFTRFRSMKVHRESVHTNLGKVKCNHCNRLYKSARSLRQHLNSLTRVKTYKCGVCHQFFATPKELEFHMISHSVEKNYSCDFCGTSYKYKAGLQSHMQKHNGVLPQCSICTKTFTSQRSLKRHSAVHTGVRSHACIVTNCDRTFYTRKLMLAHVELRHKNENLTEIISKTSV